MVHKPYHICSGIFFISLLLFTACSNNIPAVESASTSAAVSTSVQTEAPAPQVTYSVRPDYSQLTPYAPPEEIYTRLSENFMPELVPSGDYGLLLPYVWQTFSNDIYADWDLSYKGLMTAAGMIVTDAVYSEAYQAFWYDDFTGRQQKPLYVLALVPYVPEDKYDWFGGAYAMHAVCALDGSWVTPFAYTDVYCFDEAVFCVRDRETNDVDVFDYSGKLIYNIKDLPWADQLPLYFYRRMDIQNYSEGYIIIESTGGFFNVLTGKYIDTDYDRVNRFSEGLAAFKQNGKWGYIDKHFNVVIQPMTADFAGPFHNGHAYLHDNTEYKLIDKNGVVYQHSKGYIDTWNDAGVIVNDGNNKLYLYDNNLNLLCETDVNAFTAMPEGGFCVKTEDATLLFYKNKTFTYPKDHIVTSTGADYMICWFPQQAKTYLLTLDGTILTETRSDARLERVVTTPSGNTYLIFGNWDYANPSYDIYSADGTCLYSGSGSADYNDLTGLFCIRDRQFFGYADETGRFIFRHWLMWELGD